MAGPRIWVTTPLGIWQTRVPLTPAMNPVTPSSVRAITRYVPLPTPQRYSIAAMAGTSASGAASRESAT